MNEKGNAKIAGEIGAASVGPGIGVAILAKASCPFCYPAIGGFLTSIGLGFLFEGLYFDILVSLFISISLFGLAFRAKSRRGYRPFWLGTVAIFLGISGRFFNIEIMFYIGIIILVIATIWNIIPKKESCSSCSNFQGGKNE